jgi:hypothetical protein
VDERQTHPAAVALAAAVDALMSVELDGLSAVELAGVLADVEVQRRRLAAVDHRLLAEVGELGVAGEYGRTGAVDLLVNLLRVTPREARARIERAQDLGPRRALTGEPLAPLFPATAAAVGAGANSAQHADVIADCLEHVSRIASAEVTDAAEALLVDAARREQPRQLARTAALLLARLDPDGIQPAEDEMERRRGFSLAKHADGSATPRGRWTAELVAAWEAIFDSLAAPNPSAELPDQRSAAQRRHDALAEAAHRLLRSGTLPPAGGSPVAILAITTLRELAAGTGIAITGHGEQLSTATLLQLAGDAALVPVICTDTGGVLAYGRERRLASRGQRLALAARDRGCSFPGCTRPAAWTEVHHVVSWLREGGTDLDNLCLLCRYHHRHFAIHGWEAQMINGVPHWRPPSWLDPERKPIRNTAHHPPDLDFREVA